MSIDRGYGIATSAVIADSYDLDALIADTEAAKVAAQAAQAAAETAQSAAETAETNAETAETNAAASASAAATSESNIAGSEAVCAASETAAAASATAAAASETAASASETAAAASETAAATSETNAATSETNAATSETNAATSATSASSSASSASTSATAAASSASAASTSETNAAASASSASTSASTATTQASNASTSASAAATSASNASTSETNAATSASNASTSETNAATSETNAANSATAAASSATDAAAYVDTFDDTYLGAKASAPSVDNDGDALTVGDLYFDTTAEVMKVYSSSGWVTAASAINGTMNSVEYTATSGQTTFNVNYDAGYVQVYLNGVRLDEGDYTATSGTDIVLDTGATAGDTVFIQAFGTFELANFSIDDANDVNTAGVTNGQALIYNSTSGDFEAGDVATGNSAVVGWENQVTVAENYTITTNYNMMSAGPITIDTGYSVTVPTGSTWTIV